MSEHWSSAKIGDCCDILDNLRVPLNSDERGEIQGDIPYYGANGLQGHIDKFIFDEPLILLAEDGGYFDEYESRPIAYRISGKSWVNNHAHILRANIGSSFFQDFIFYCLEHKNITPFIKGGTRAKLNQAELREILIPKPPKPVQYRIAEILSTLDESIEQTEALIAKYEQIKAGLMHDLFTLGVTPDGRQRPSQEARRTKFGWMPKDWRIGSLLDVADGARQAILTGPFGADLGNDDFVAEGVPVLRIGNVQQGRLDLVNLLRVTEAKAQQLQRYKVREGDLLFARQGATTGRNALASKDVEGWLINYHIIRVALDHTKCAPMFIEAAFAGEIVKRQVERDKGRGTREGINTAQLKALELPLASVSEQRAIARILITHELLCLEATKQLAKLQKQKNGLMHDLLTGRVRVKVAAAAAA